MSNERGINSSSRFWQLSLALGCLLVVSLVVVACTSNSATTASGMGTVSVSISDPATCQLPSGPYSAVWVTITEVDVNMSATAGNSDSGWQPVTPKGMTPQQINLLGSASPECLLATLGDAMQLQAGSYQQIRLMLAPNNGQTYGTNCGSANNCVVIGTGSSAQTYPLLLSSEAQTGIKIPSGQIAGGAFKVAQGQTEDLDIDIQTCVSIVPEGNGQYRLKPVLRAGEVTPQTDTMNGKVVDAENDYSNVTVTLEELDTSAGIDRIVLGPKPLNADGTWTICPVMTLVSGSTSTSTFDVVISGTKKDGLTPYAPTIITGVGIGDTTGTVTLNPSTATTLSGLFTSAGGSPSGPVSIDVLASALEPGATMSSPLFTIPLPKFVNTGITPPINQITAESTYKTTAQGTTICGSASVDCAPYTMVLPAGGAYIGQWSSGTISFSQTGTSAKYEVDGIASPLTGGGTDCSPFDMQSSQVTAVSGSTVSVPTIAFTGCS